MTVRRWLVAGLCVVTSGFALQAATVELIVTDDSGAPVPGQLVRLVRPLPEDGRPLSLQLMTAVGTRWQLTGLDGRALFEQVEPGTWSPVARLPRGAAFVDEPEPLALSELTIVREDERAIAGLVLRRGARVRFRMSSTHPDELFGTVLPVQVPASLERFRVSSHEDTVRTLPGGRWQFGLQAPDGTASVSVDVDGVPLDVDHLVLDLEAAGPERVITWQLASSGAVEGSVDAERPTTGMELELTLVEPGPAFAALAAARRPFEPIVRISPDPRDGRYATPLLDGTWRVAPVGRRVRSAEPRSRLVTITSGATARADFAVELEEDVSPSLIVEVVDPRGVRLPHALVRVEPLEGPPDPPVAQGLTDEVRETFVVRRLDAGSYRVVGSREGFTAAARELRDFEQGARPEWVRIQLGRGGSIRVRAQDGEERPVSAVSLALRGQSQARPRLVRTDTTGWATFSGLEPGTYELVATGEFLQAPAIVRFAGSSRAGVRVTLDGEEDRELQLQVLPPALAMLTLACDDGASVGSRVELAWVRPEPAGPEDWIREMLEGVYREGRIPSVPGTNDEPDTRAELTRARPRGWAPVEETGVVRSPALEGGTYRLAMRPADFDRWTWLPGTEELAEATAVELVEGETVEIPPMTLLCAPRVALTLPTEVIDLGRAGTKVTMRPLGTTRWVRADLTAFADRLEIGPLPEGKVKLRAVLCAASSVHGDQGAETCMRVDAPAGDPIVATAELELARGRITIWNWRPEASPTGAPNDHQIAPHSK